jgi:D-amino-acid oxidase
MIGDWNRELDRAITADIFKRVAKVDKRLAGAKVLREFVGLRPGREEPRLETEMLAAGCTVIHNYGHGAVGYTLSWGCALEVASLARKAIAR